MWNQIGRTSSGYWAKYRAFPFDHTHNLVLDFSRSKFEIALSQQSKGRFWHGTKRMWVNHSWRWAWLLCDHGGVGGCTGMWMGWLQMSTCQRHMWFITLQFCISYKFTSYWSVLTHKQLDRICAKYDFICWCCLLWMKYAVWYNEYLVRDYWCPGSKVPGHQYPHCW